LTVARQKLVVAFDPTSDLQVRGLNVSMRGAEN
jgi:hypothetical protein